jgi:hypothetical protein
MFWVMTADSDAGLAARAEVARTAATQPGRLRRCSAVGLLALLSAAALAPAAIAGGGVLATALAGVAGNIGGGLLSGVIDRAIARLHDGKAAPLESGAVRDALETELLAALQQGDSTAQSLSVALTDLLMRIDGFGAAVEAVGDDLRGHLQSCCRELAAQQGEVLGRLGAIDAGQLRQERQLRYQVRLIEEMADRLRLFTRLLADWSAAGPGTASSSGLSPAVIHLAAPGAGPAPPRAAWSGGAEILAGDRVYLLHGHYLEECFSADHCVLLRQARGLRLTPAGEPDHEHVWLRQVETRRDGPVAKVALSALAGERDLLTRLGAVRGLPRVSQLVAGGRTATLALLWPTSRPGSGSPCETLHSILGENAAPMDSWRMFRLFTGLAGLCGTLAALHDGGVAHRNLTPPGILMLDDGRLVLRDLGLAARNYQPGEGPADYQAPEQRRGGHGRSGPQADVYQLAAVAYHLVAGHPPHPRIPLPLRAQARAVPERISAGLDAALAADPGRRPGIRWLGDAFRAARDDLS